MSEVCWRLEGAKRLTIGDRLNDIAIGGYFYDMDRIGIDYRWNDIDGFYGGERFQMVNFM